MILILNQLYYLGDLILKSTYDDFVNLCSYIQVVVQ